MTDACSHQDAWLSLPWLANGRLSGAERLRVEEHVRGCALCTREVALQRRLCDVLTEPERVTYAPAPSFRKLMDRIDGLTPATPAEPSPAPLRLTARHSSAWRPPGLAWAASFLLLVGVAGLAATTYRWSQPRYNTYTSVPETSTALHVAFVPSLPIADVGDALRNAGARVVEGPDATGIFGVVPAATAANAADARPALRALAVRLRADARVRWVEPLAGTAAAETLPHGPPQP
ncbi:MAG TPA: zf-HC2 domain-containing protein [Steroidobacteraceae bacterium]|nr:zf-HC2 domain-containing protein [Steroidobacteraceae bacterium]